MTAGVTSRCMSRPSRSQRRLAGPSSWGLKRAGTSNTTARARAQGRRGRCCTSGHKPRRLRAAAPVKPKARLDESLNSTSREKSSWTADRLPLPMVTSASDQPDQLAGEPMADLLGPLWRVVLEVVKIAIGEVQLGCEVQADHVPLPTGLQCGRVDAGERAALIHAVGSLALHDADEPAVFQPIVGAGLGDEDRHRSKTLDQIRDTDEPGLVHVEVGLQPNRLPAGRSGPVGPFRSGKIYRAVMQFGPVGSNRAGHDGPQTNKCASLLELSAEPDDVEAVSPSVPDEDVVYADVDQHQARFQMRNIGNPELEIRDDPDRALAIEAAIGHDGVAAGLTQGPLQHRLPRRLFRKVQLVRRAAAEGQDGDPGRIDAGSAEAHGIALVDELSSPRIQRRGRNSDLDVARDGKLPERVRPEPLPEYQLGHEDKA